MDGVIWQPGQVRYGQVPKLFSWQRMHVSLKEIGTSVKSRLDRSSAIDNVDRWIDWHQNSWIRLVSFFASAPPSFGEPWPKSCPVKSHLYSYTYILYISIYTVLMPASWNHRANSLPNHHPYHGWRIRKNFNF